MIIDDIKLTYMKAPINRWTFSVKPIREWIESRSEYYTLNLFAGTTKLNINEVRNDINKDLPALYHYDALNFIKGWSKFKNERFDTVILDPPFCYDSKTEVLTENGWKYFNELNGEKIASLNQETGYLEYQNYTNYLQNLYSGKMIKIKSGSIDLVVTPNHKMYVKKLWKNNKYKLIEAQDINFGFECKSDCKWEGIEKEYFVLPEVKFAQHNRYGKKIAVSKKIKMDNWLKFLGIYLADGCTDPKGTQYRTRITVRLASHRREKIENIIKNINFHYIEEKDCFSIYNKQLCVYLRQFGKTREKYISKDIKQLSKRQLNILLDSLVFCDGHKKRFKKWNEKYKKYYIDSYHSYTSFSKQLIDDFSEISLKLGYVPNFTLSKKSNGGVIRITKHRKSPMIRKSKFNDYVKTVQYDGLIYCLTVPNNIIYVRRNGRPTWCGNSMRKSMELFNGNMNSRFKLVKDNLYSILKSSGCVITFGYHSCSMGKNRGYEQEEILLISHGGATHDTIAVKERYFD